MTFVFYCSFIGICLQVRKLCGQYESAAGVPPRLSRQVSGLSLLPRPAEGRPREAQEAAVQVRRAKEAPGGQRGEEGGQDGEDHPEIHRKGAQEPGAIESPLGKL